MNHPPKNIVIDWLNTIWETDLPYQSKYLACYLRKFMNSQHDMAYPSYARIIHETGLSRATVARYMESLESEGWLVRNRGRKGKNTEYTATFPSSITQRLADKSKYHTETKVVSERDLGSIRERHELNNTIKQVINNKKKSPKTYSEADLSIAVVMYKNVLLIAPKTKKPNFDKWANTIRLMVEKDGHTHDEILEVFKWANSDDFWKANICSPEKLRKQFATLHSRTINHETNQRTNQPSRPSAVDRVRIAAEKREADRTAREGNGQAMAAPIRDIRASACQPVRGDNTGELGTIIDGSFTRSNS